jgi:hypothetical protein
MATMRMTLRRCLGPRGSSPPDQGRMRRGAVRQRLEGGIGVCLVREGEGEEERRECRQWRRRCASAVAFIRACRTLWASVPPARHVVLPWLTGIVLTRGYVYI